MPILCFKCSCDGCDRLHLSGLYLDLVLAGTLLLFHIHRRLNKCSQIWESWGADRNENSDSSCRELNPTGTDDWQLVVIPARSVSSGA